MADRFALPCSLTAPFGASADVWADARAWWWYYANQPEGVDAIA
ncbi:MAG TPA: hypothetical protein VIC33_14385 [Vicinamibacterales bacterium]|jgi:hypothetical protein